MRDRAIGRRDVRRAARRRPSRRRRVSMPSSRHARMMRTAISPRLAMRRRLIIGLQTSAQVRCPASRLPLLEKRAQPFLAFGARRAARRSPRAVIGRGLVERPAPHVADERLGRRDRLRAGGEDLAHVRRRRPRRARPPARRRARARSPARARAEKRAPVRNSSRAADRPILASDERRDHRRHDAELHLGEAEHRLRPRRRRCRRPRRGRRRRRAPRRGRGR